MLGTEKRSISAGGIGYSESIQIQMGSPLFGSEARRPYEFPTIRQNYFWIFFETRRILEVQCGLKRQLCLTHIGGCG